MDTEVFSHLLSKVTAAPLESYPFPYFHMEGIFPDSYYQEIFENIPDIAYFASLVANYPKRFCLEFEKTQLEKLPFYHAIFWRKFAMAFGNRTWVSAVLKKFELNLDAANHFTLELIRDQSDYSIGPHTDQPNKVLTLLFYMPTSADQKQLGTSLYIPKERSFRCAGTLHHSFKDFDRVYTVPFVPNSVFGFVKSDVSFHGVEPIGKQEKERTLIAYTLWKQSP